MTANTAPIFSRTPDCGFGVLATANTAKDGTGTVVTVFTADATEGGRLDEIVSRALGTNVATVLRFFLNNGSTNATATNNTLIYELTIAATTLSEVAQQAHVVWAAAKALRPGYKINCTIGTTIAAGIHVTAFGGKY